VRAAAYEAVEALCRALGDAASHEEARVGFAAAWADPSPIVRAAAASAILERCRGARVGPLPGAEEISLVVRLLGDPTFAVRDQVGDLLWEVDDPEEAAVLVRAIAQAGGAARRSAECCFARSRETYVPAVAKLLDDPDPSVRSWAALVLARMSAKGCLRAEQIPALLVEREVEVRFWALGEAAALEAPQHDAILIGALAAPSPAGPGETEGARADLAGEAVVRAKAAQLLRARGARGAKVFAALEAALQDPERAPRIAAAVAVLDIEPAHEGAARVLSREIREAPSWTKVHVLREVRTLRGKAHGVLSAVSAAASDPSPAVVEQARLILEALGKAGAIR
jgi:HEAT repeat protein